MKAVLSYYTATITLTAEGDTSIGGDTLEGLGRTPNFLKIFFGALFHIAAPPKSGPLVGKDQVESPVLAESTDRGVESTSDRQQVHVTSDQQLTGLDLTSSNGRSTTSLAIDHGNEVEEEEEEDIFQVPPSEKSLLMSILPDPGYFAAGGLAGVVSRTATAPLDRLKVYLIANTGVGRDSLESVKQGDHIAAVKKVGRPLIDATKDLWKAGGIRSLFAGELFY